MRKWVPKKARGSLPIMEGLRDLCVFLRDNESIETMVEVGSYMGESATTFEELLGCTVHCVDPWQDYVNLNLEVVGMAEVEDIFDEVTKGLPNIIKTKGTSAECVQLFEDDSLDFVYIDANHDYEFVKHDISLWLPKVKKNHFIGGHDFKQPWHGVIKAVRETVGSRTIRLRTLAG